MSLYSAHIRGSLDCRHARFDNPSGYSINAARLSLRGEMLCEKDFTAHGEVCLENAKIGRLQATGGSFSNSSGYALHGDALRARTGVYLDRGFHARGGVRLVGAVITGGLICTDSTFHNPGRKALDVRRLRTQDVYLDRGFRAHGQVRIDGAQLTRQLNCTNGKFDNDQGYALDGDGIRCDGEVFLNKGFTATGEVRLIGAQITYELNCTDGHFNNAAGTALDAEGLTTENVFLNSETDHEFHALGKVSLRRATIGQQLMLSGAVLQDANSCTLDLTGLVCHGNVLLNKDFRSNGEIRMPGARIARDLDFTDSKLHGDQQALDARGVQVDGCLRWKLAQPPWGKVDLSVANVTRLNDTLASWPDNKFTLTGFVYRTLDENWTVDDRIAWLGKTEHYSPDAYQQLTNVYRMNGKEDDAAKVAIARQRNLRNKGGLSKRSKLWNQFLDITTGYGYQLHRPLVLLAGFAIIGAIIFTWAQSASLMHATNPPYVEATRCLSGYLCFQPIVYSLQLLMPVVDLQETSRWLPDTSTTLGRLVMLYTWIAIVIGWAASGAVAAGFGRLLRQR